MGVIIYSSKRAQNGILIGINLFSHDHRVTVSRSSNTKGLCMDIDYHLKNDVPVINTGAGEGRLTDKDINDFALQIINASRPSSKTIAFNMSSHSFLNSTGLGELILVKDRLLDRNIRLVLIQPSPRVKSLLTMAGLDRFFTIYDSEDEIR
jgi:anti-anti-sigma factor